MRTLYLECNMGAAGDMLTAALLELLPQARQEEVLEQLRHLGLPGVEIHAEKATKCGITGTHMVVTVNGEEEHSEDIPLEKSPAEDAQKSAVSSANKELTGHCHEHSGAAAYGGESVPADIPHDHEHALHDHSHDDHQHSLLDHTHDDHVESEHDHAEHHHGHHHHHTSLHDVEEIVGRMDLPADVRDDILSVYNLIGEAEGHAHGMPVDQIHFHEVGTMDAIMDVASVCFLIHELHPEQILCSPVRVGFGEVRCAHGIMPVPAPATAYLLQGIPTYSGDIRGEMCTPTGAALLRYYVKAFTRQPLMKTEKVGYGMGSKDFPAANCVRAFFGDTLPAGAPDAAEDSSSSSDDLPAIRRPEDHILELRCNIDDMTGEELGFAMQTILDAGARDVFTTPIGMKKNRPGVLLTVICSPEDKAKLVPVIFRSTTTLGIRETICSRSVLSRTTRMQQTPYGEVPVKISRGYGVVREKIEYDAAARVAAGNGQSLREAREELQQIGRDD